MTKMLMRNLFQKSYKYQFQSSFHTSSSMNYKVAIIGAAGRVGQPLSMLLKRSPYIRDLSLYDATPLAAGVAADLSHIQKRTKVKAHSPDIEGLQECLKDADITLLTPGRPRDPGMSRMDLFENNAKILAPIIKEVGIHAPETMLCLITNPINSLVPMAAEILRGVTAYDERRLFGITTLDSVRASTFVAELKGIKTGVYVPVMGGHSESTLIPVFSQAVPSVSFPPDVRRSLTRKIQTAGTEVVAVKEGGGSASLSMAYSADRFVGSLLSAMRGYKGIVECAFVRAPASPCEYFATPVILGEEGIKSNMGVGNLIEYELDLLRAAIPEIEENIRTGKKFAKDYLSKL